MKCVELDCMLTSNHVIFLWSKLTANCYKCIKGLQINTIFLEIFLKNFTCAYSLFQIPRNHVNLTVTLPAYCH